MSIKITIKKKEPVKTKTTLQIRKALNGDFMINDHPDIYIVVMPEKMKIITFAKEIFDDKIYDTMDRLFKFLIKKGLIDFQSIKSGNVYGSLEGVVLSGEQGNSIDLSILNIGNWMDDERPYYERREALEKQEEKRLLEPDMEESTELGEIPSALDDKNIPDTRKSMSNYNSYRMN